MSDDTPKPSAWLTLDGETLVERVKELVRPDDRDRHWSILATSLGRITDEKLHKGYVSAEAWARGELDLAKGEYTLALKLWRLMGRCLPVVQIEEWHTLEKGRALLLDEVLAAGGDVAEWFRKAKEAKSTEAFLHLVDALLKREPFTNWRVYVPTAILPVLEAAFERVLPDVLEAMEESPASTDPNAERYAKTLLADERYRWRCLQALAVHALQTIGTVKQRELL